MPHVYVRLRITRNKALIIATDESAKRQGRSTMQLCGYSIVYRK